MASCPPTSRSRGRGARVTALVVVAWLPCAGALHAIPAAQGAAKELQVVLVQGTNRPVPSAFDSTDAAALMAKDEPPGVVSDWLSAAQIAEYARRHGYAYRMYAYNSTYKDACRHPTRGPLLAQWCKILAIRFAMEDFPQASIFAWIDTDAYVIDMNMTIKQVMDSKATLRYQNMSDTSQCKIEEPPLGRERVSIFAWRNSPWDGGCGPNTGVMIFRRTEATRQFVQAWWDNAMQKGIPGPYDQGYVYRILYPQHPDKIAVFEEDSLRFRASSFVVHRCGKCKWVPKRVELMQQLFERQGLNIADLNSMLKQVQVRVDTRIRDGL